MAASSSDIHAGDDHGDRATPLSGTQLRPGQFYLQTWHGTPLKKLLWDLPEHRVPLTYRRLMRREVPTWDLLLAADPAAADLRSGLGYDGEVLLMPQPRNIRLLAGEEGCAATRAALGIGDDVPVVLYAPTWRNVHRAGRVMAWDDYLDPADLAIGQDGVVLVRAHHVTRARAATGERVIDVSAYPHVEDLILAADVLVTDYSSVAFDFAITGKPVVQYAPDLKDYSRERGFYRDWPATSPWPVTTTAMECVARVTESYDTVHRGGVDRTWYNGLVDRLHGVAERIVARALTTDP